MNGIGADGMTPPAPMSEPNGWRVYFLGAGSTEMASASV